MFFDHSGSTVNPIIILMKDFYFSPLNYSICKVSIKSLKHFYTILMLKKKKDEKSRFSTPYNFKTTEPILMKFETNVAMNGGGATVKFQEV